MAKPWARGLWEAAERGKKRCWEQAHLKAVEGWLEEEHSYASRQLSEKLAKEREVEIQSKWLQRLLKKRGGSGNDCAIFLPNQSGQIANTAIVGSIRTDVPQVCR